MKLANCALVKDEALYLREWLEFNLLQGFTKHYLYDNCSTDDTLAVLQPYIDSGVVEMIDGPDGPGSHFDSPPVFKVYQKCLDQHCGEDTWLAFMDVDEFLWSPEFPTALAALETLPLAWGAVGVNWLMFNGSGQEKREPGLVLERFTWRAGDQFYENRHIKSVIRMNQHVTVGGDPHFFHVERDTYSERGELLTGPRTDFVSVDLLRLNHYYTKSHEECELRAAKGRHDIEGGYIWGRWGAVPQTADVVDQGVGGIQRFLPELKERLNLNGKF